MPIEMMINSMNSTVGYSLDMLDRSLIRVMHRCLSSNRQVFSSLFRIARVPQSGTCQRVSSSMMPVFVCLLLLHNKQCCPMIDTDNHHLFRASTVHSSLVIVSLVFTILVHCQYLFLVKKITRIFKVEHRFVFPRNYQHEYTNRNTCGSFPIEQFEYRCCDTYIDYVRDNHCE
jgi:hypothetical protein